MGYATFYVYLYGDVTRGKDSRRNRETRSYKMHKMFPGVIIHTPPSYDMIMQLHVFSIPSKSSLN
jgi:hypothetical protein